MIDTSAFYALADRGDVNNAAAHRIRARLAAERVQIFTTNIIVIESHALILSRLGPQKARDWLRSLPVPVVRASEEDEERGKAIVLQYQDKDFSLADAISFAVMEKLGLDRAFAFDDHFLQYGFRVLPG